MSSPCNACQRERTPTSSKKCTHSSRSAPSSRLEMASTGCCFHNRRAIRLSSRRANRQSSRSTRFVVISSLFCMVGPPSGVLPLSEDQPRIKLIPYVGISDRVVQRTLEEFGKIDVLVNNHGASFRAPVENISLNGWDAVVSINLHGVFLFCQTVGKHMIERRQGVIVN